jgi:hypothetical protein
MSKLFIVCHGQEIVEKYAGLKLFTARHCLQKASELFLALNKNFLDEFVFLDWQWRH